jgi:glycosyltransferase involved in cell wall biosynthesis
MTTQQRPVVGVVMPVFNQRVHFFREAVESVLRQTYTDLHLIIVDDGSTDAKLIHHMDNYVKDRRVTLITNETNRGIAFSINLGIKVAKEIQNITYIARMDSDDICFKDRLMAQVSFMELNPSIDICGTSMIILR